MYLSQPVLSKAQSLSVHFSKRIYTIGSAKQKFSLWIKVYVVWKKTHSGMDQEVYLEWLLVADYFLKRIPTPSQMFQRVIRLQLSQLVHYNQPQELTRSGRVI